MNYELIENEHEISVLHRGGKELLCPFSDESVCGSWCVLFGIRETVQGISITLNCASGGATIVIPRGGIEA